MAKVLVIGNGIAGLSCARLLVDRGWEVEIWGQSPAFSPTILLNQVTCGILQDIWQLETSFWQLWHPLQERRVCWGRDGAVSEMAEPSAAIGGNILCEALRSHLLDKYSLQVSFRELNQDKDTPLSLYTNFDLIIDAGGRRSTVALQLGGGCRHPFGNRRAISREVELNASTPEDIYWIETVAEGWLFLAPLGNNRAILQAMVPEITGAARELLTLMLGRSGYIQYFIAKLSGSVTVFSAYPQILQPLCGDHYLAVGDAAFSVDPISGDGTGYALRGAILATSAIASDCNRQDALAHYAMRLEKTFANHLQQCLEYYLNGFASPLWEAEIETMQKARQLWHPREEEFKYALSGFQLAQISK